MVVDDKRIVYILLAVICAVQICLTAVDIVPDKLPAVGGWVVALILALTSMKRGR